MALAPVSPGALFVFALIAVALVLFVSEAVPTDITAVGIIVTLVVFEPWTGVSATAGISGFSSPATITIVAMYMLSAGIQRTGLVQRLGAYLGRITRGDERRMLAATVGATGPIAGFINNTPVVAVFIPMITDLADANGLSPSKLLLPLSYAAMLGGTLTLIGTSTNLIASDLSRQLLGRPIGMFEFTQLGLVVLVVGSAYLLTVGRWLTPARIDPHADLVEEHAVEDSLARVRVRAGSPLVGRPVATALDDREDEVDVLQVVRPDGEVLVPSSDRPIDRDDVLTLRGSMQAVNQLAEATALQQLPREVVTEAELEHPAGETAPVEAIVPPDSGFVGVSVAAAKFPERYETTVLAVKRGETSVTVDLDDVTLEAGDTLLLQTTPASIDLFAETGDLLPTHGLEGLGPPEIEGPTRPALDPKTPIAVAVMVGVVVLAALGAVPIVIAALGGVVTMVVTRVLSPAEAYDAVSWSVIFLLAGVIPLGVALQRTGGDAVVAALLIATAAVVPPIVVLGLVYVLTGLLSNVITPVASVVLLIPVAVDTAAGIGANRFAFLLAVMFAGSTAFMTPVGYQTNLMVYGPGGYRFSDYIRVGGPLQLLLAVVTTVGIAFFWGVA